MTLSLPPRYDFSLRPTRRTAGPASTALSLLLHILLIMLLLVPLRRDFARVLDLGTPGGQRGGGGGGGRGGVAYITLPLPKATPRVAVPVAPTNPAPSPVPVVTPSTVSPPPEPVAPVTEPAPQASAAPPDSAAGAGPGQGGGTGGGTGGGQGPGTGPGSGPGDGGSGGAGKGRAPQIRHQPIPPTDVPKELRGVSIRVTLWIAANGKIDRVATDPPIRDHKFADQFTESMLSYRYRPALGPDGTAVASTDTVTIVLY